MFAIRKDHLDTERKYVEVRETVFSVVTEKFGVEARGVTRGDCFIADRWETMGSLNGQRLRSARGTWEWAELYGKYRNKPNRFEIALCSNGELCALSYGETSRAGTKVKLNFIESTPVKPSPLGQKALPILTYSAFIFALAVEADEVWVVNPLKTLEGLYNSVGFGDREVYHCKQFGQKLRLKEYEDLL